MESYNGKVAIVGFGNMGKAIYNGLVNAKVVLKENIIIIGRDESRDISMADVVFIAVKPQIFENVFRNLSISAGALVISVAAAISLEEINAWHPKAETFNIVRAMPNVAASVGESMTALCGDATQMPLAVKLFSCIGEVEVVDESQINAIVAISGSSPAYVFMFIEALADAGVNLGLSRKMAYKLASQAVKGAGALQLSTNEHPAVLKDQVCSPGGTTIAAVTQLEQSGFRGAVIAGVDSCYERIMKLSNSKK